ncbi:restriction endonuclease subunit S [Streptococcus mitis]|uniref:Restriction endonuclease subunit S n=1 Tax=Streptococcus mitis TaxID=28037 RepID=A0A4U1KXI5_STRMT|nr:restriction endonuclease subunit S [Streptococcus mitis]TKD49049.1 restriction endonuclease subunit S [Streptococcus mitis]
MKNEAKIRFKKYNDVWENVKLTEIVPIVMGQSPDSKNYTDNPNDYILVQGNADMQNGRVVPRLWTTQITKLAEKGDLILSVRAPVGDIGKTDYNVVIGRGVAAIRGNEFIFQLLSRMKQTNYWAKFSTGSTFESINSSDIKLAEIYLPSQDEQSAIGSLFRTLDDLLASHKDNLSNYQSLKATMLSKMFPKAGQTVPEIRLDGFDGEWEKVKLKDVTESIEYGLNASAKEFDGENKYIRITDIDDVSRKFKEDSLTSPDIDVSECDNYLLCEKDILFARTGASVGKTYLYIKKDGKVYFAGFLIRARIKDKFDSKFIFQNTLTDRFTQYVKVTSQRSGQPGVNGKEYGEYELYLPNYEEQQAIGAYFSNLDNLINSYQEKISQLEILKKKLLQDMFI